MARRTYTYVSSLALALAAWLLTALTVEAHAGETHGTGASAGLSDFVPYGLVALIVAVMFGRLLRHRNRFQHWSIDQTTESEPSVVERDPPLVRSSVYEQR